MWGLVTRDPYNLLTLAAVNVPGKPKEQGFQIRILVGSRIKSMSALNIAIVSRRLPVVQIEVGLRYFSQKSGKFIIKGARIGS